MNTPTTHPTDLSNAHRFATQHAHHLRYVPTWGWLTWDGTRWHKTSSLTSLARETIQDLYASATTPTDPSLTTNQLTIQHAHRSSSLASIKAMLTLASNDPALITQPSQFDTHPLLLNVLNGTLDLRTGDLKPHDPHDFITRLIPIAYNPHAISPIWDSFLAQITQRNSFLCQYIQRAVGYSLTSSTREEALFILYGPGRNGKSTFLTAISSILGDYAQHAPTSSFTHNSAPLTLTSSLPSTRLMLLSETSSNQLLDLSILKRITSGEAITVRSSHERTSFQPHFKLWLATNNLPSIPEQSIAIWQRVKLIPFTASFVGREDKELSTKLFDAFPAILAWAVQGCRLWLQEGWREPDCVQAATLTYKENQDALADFFHDCCTIDNKPDTHVKARELYNVYKLWCQTKGVQPLSETLFAANILSHGHPRERKNSGKIYHGITLIPRIASAFSKDCTTTPHIPENLDTLLLPLS